MAIIKVQSEGVNLSDTFAFTGTVTGAGEASPFGNTVTATSEGGAVTTNVVQGLAKAWANFHQNGTQSIDGSINIASITDGGTGESSFTFSNALSNGNDNIPTTTVGSGLSNTHSTFNLARTTVVKIETYAASSYTDASEINVLVHGDLA